jgi:hypothetical protein
MRIARLRFSIASILGVTALVAVAMSLVTYPARKRAQTIATYDAQKKVVVESVAEFADALTKDWFDVVDDSTGVGGSGDWRHYIAVTATDEKGSTQVCYVEVMGFVTHDKNDKPTWMRVLPMRISHRRRKLNDRYLDLLIAKLRERTWTYTIDSRCKGDGWFKTFNSDHYLTAD